MKRIIIAVGAFIIAMNFNNFSHAEVYFEFDGESGYQYLGPENAHPGGGYFSRIGGNVNSPEGTGCSDPMSYHNTILSSEPTAIGAVADSNFSLKTPYSGSCPNESFSRDTTIINTPDLEEYYIRWYQKWTGDWNSSDTQHKFTKFYRQGTGDSLTAHFSFNRSSNNWRNYIINLEDRFDMNNVERAAYVWVYETEEGAGSEYPGVNRAWDDINNGIGLNGTDAQFDFQTGVWYCIEIHAKLNTDANTADAVLEAWVDGNKVFEIKNFKYYNDPAAKAATNIFELQHIYYNRSATDQPTYMDNIIISDSYNGPVTDIPLNELSPPTQLTIISQ
ncbi:MAG: hypothetical protein C4548_09460 [Desulfobacteraceae bacterium]|jgi:hypothetical protein|nr:MAG: hypothetical protein C4548_09460 [Desulfobacteraceae bacterium]